MDAGGRQQHDSGCAYVGWLDLPRKRFLAKRGRGQESRLAQRLIHVIAPALPPVRLHRALPSEGGGAPASRAAVLHEIKHDGFRLMAWRDGERVRLFTRNGNDWRARFPLIEAATIELKVRSCLIDGEAVCCDENGLAVFQELRRRQSDDRVFLYAFDLLELNGTDLRRE